jgi:hypothetical protein
MNAQQYITLLKITDILQIIFLLVSAYSAYVMIKRKGKPIVQIFQFYYWFALGCGIFSTTILAILVYFKKNLQYNPETFDSHTLNMATNLLIFLLIYTTIGIVVQWMCSHYSIEIKDDRFVYHHLFFGKEDILYSEIDIEKSKYCFVNSEKTIIRLSGCETLYLVMKCGKEYRFKFEENIFLNSPIYYLFPKAKELGIFLDSINLKYRKLSEAFSPPELEDNNAGKELNKNNDKILKRKKAKKAKKKAQNKKKRRNN